MCACPKKMATYEVERITKENDMVHYAYLLIIGPKILNLSHIEDIEFACSAFTTLVVLDASTGNAGLAAWIPLPILIACFYLRMRVVCVDLISREQFGYISSSPACFHSLRLWLIATQPEE